MDAPASRLDRLRDPLLERDYVRLCSRPAAFRNRFFAAFIVGVVFLLVYVSASQYESNDKIGANLHITFTWLASLYVWGLASSEAAVAIPSERSTGALTVLLTVPRTPRRLAVGFFLSRVCFSLTALLAMLPIDGAAILLGGVSLSSFLTSMLLVLVSAAWGTAIGLHSGYGAPTHRHAVGRALFTTLTLAVLLPLCIVMVPWLVRLWRSPGPGLGSDAEEAFAWAAGAVFVANPLGALFFFTGSRLLPLPLGAEVYAIPVGVTAILAVEAVIRTGKRLRDDTERTILVGSAPGPWALVKSLFRRNRAAPPPAVPVVPAPAAVAATAEVAPDRTPTGSPANPGGPLSSASPAAAERLAKMPGPRTPVRVWSRSLWWKEARPPRSAWQRLAFWFGAAVYFLFLSYLFFHQDVRKHFANESYPTPFYDVWMSVPLWILVLGATASGGTFLAEERERLSLDHLRTAPFGAVDFILARVVATAVRIAPIIAVTALFCLVGLVTGQVHFGALVAWAVGFAPVMAFLPLFSFWVGMKHQTVRAANRWVALTIGSLVVGWPVAIAFLASIFRRGGGDDIYSFNFLNPLFALTGPFLYYCRWQFSRTSDDMIEKARIACMALAVWGFVAWRLWSRLPKALDRAFHLGEEA